MFSHMLSTLTDVCGVQVAQLKPLWVKVVVGRVGRKEVFKWVTKEKLGWAELTVWEGCVMML